MARPPTVPPPDRSPAAVADLPVIPVPPVAWSDALEATLQLDLLQVRLGLRADGLTPAEVEIEMLRGYRPRLLAWAGAVCDAFTAELSWLAA